MKYTHVLIHYPNLCFLGTGDGKVRDFGKKMGDQMRARDSNTLWEKGKCKYITSHILSWKNKFLLPLTQEEPIFS